LADLIARDPIYNRIFERRAATTLKRGDNSMNEHGDTGASCRRAQHHLSLHCNIHAFHAFAFVPSVTFTCTAFATYRTPTIATCAVVGYNAAQNRTSRGRLTLQPLLFRNAERTVPALRAVRMLPTADFLAHAGYTNTPASYARWRLLLRAGTPPHTPRHLITRHAPRCRAAARRMPHTAPPVVRSCLFVGRTGAMPAAAPYPLYFRATTSPTRYRTTDDLPSTPTTLHTPTGATCTYARTH